MAADVKSLNIDELTGLVNLYPWFGLARKELCARMAAISGSNWGEEQFADEIFYNPKHEYTKGLMRSIPTVDNDGQKLEPIAGTPIDLLNMPQGCPFAPRCDAAMKICLRERCQRMQINDMHQAACWQNVTADSLTANDVWIGEEPEDTFSF